MKIWTMQCSGVGVLIARRVARRRTGTGRGEVRQEMRQQSAWVTRTRAASRRRREKGIPIAAVQDNKTKMVMAKVVPSKGLREYAVEVVMKVMQQ